MSVNSQDSFGSKKQEGALEIQVSKKESKSRELELPKTRENSTKGDLAADLCHRVTQGTRLSEIRREIVESGDKGLALVFVENFDKLKDLQLQNGEILRKRPQSRPPEEESKVQKLLRTEKGEMKLPPKEEEPGKRRTRLSRKRFGQEEEEEGEIKEKKAKNWQDESELLANCCAYYRHQVFFDEKIRPLPGFKKELKAFEETLSLEQKKGVEEAMNRGFNPVYYIYKYKRTNDKSETLRQMLITIRKKGLRNSFVLEIVYKYIEDHLRNL